MAGTLRESTTCATRTVTVEVTRPQRHPSPPGHLQCPFCHAYEVGRLFVAPGHLDACECVSCGACWEEDAHTGKYRGRSRPSSVFVRRR
ncbi:MAG: hypothetical protein E6G06_17135 [Actinobacteria bacterium]|nr:MAG: hypothetical protein E6G06_17135 [Actinomycetota bacterium]